MAVVRFFSLAIMMFGALFSIYKDPFDGESESSRPPFLSDVAIADPSGLGLMFSTALFSQLFQHSVPGLMHPLSRRDKRKVR